MSCPTPPDRPIFVHVFLRGGADGLGLVPPYADPDYARYRATIGLSDPDAGGCLDLDGFFGLHPALAPVHPLFDAGELAVLHGIGTQDRSRSHFEAQDHLEHAGADLASGWLARHLQLRSETGPLTAIAFGRRTPELLRGAPSVTVLEDLDSLPAPPGAGLRSGLEALYGVTGGPLGQAGGRTLASLSALDRARAAPAPPGAWPEGRFGRQLRDLARLITADAEVEIACVDLDGWDTHFVQGALLGSLSGQLGSGLAAFRAAIGPAWQRTVVVVISEFGRRIAENGSLGTDHGSAGAALVLGGGVRGGQVLTDWRGLAPGLVEDAHDLPVTIDARDVWAEVLCGHLGQGALEEVLPDYRAQALGIL